METEVKEIQCMRTWRNIQIYFNLNIFQILIGSRNAPFSCYEEIQGQTDRFGNCGKDRQNRYIFCGWRCATQNNTLYVIYLFYLAFVLSICHKFQLFHMPHVHGSESEGQGKVQACTLFCYEIT